MIVLYRDKPDAARECKTTIGDVIRFAFFDIKNRGMRKLCMIVHNNAFPLKLWLKDVCFPCIINEELLHELITLHTLKIHKHSPVKLSIKFANLMFR